MSEHVRGVKPHARALAHTLLNYITRDFALGTRGYVIGIAGESGSGKSTSAAALARALEGAGRRCVTIHQDDYFLRPPRTNHDYRLANLGHVGPHEVNLALVTEHIAAFRAGCANVVAPAVDYPGNRFVDRQLDFSACDVLIVEGTYVLGLPGLDVRIFFEATHEETGERRRHRARDIDAPVIREILTIEHAFIAPQAQQADIVVDRNFSVRRPPHPLT